MHFTMNATTSVWESGRSKIQLMNMMMMMMMMIIQRKDIRPEEEDVATLLKSYVKHRLSEGAVDE